jgi:hypothetical protein
LVRGRFRIGRDDEHERIAFDQAALMSIVSANMVDRSGAFMALRERERASQLMAAFQSRVRREGVRRGAECPWPFATIG